METSEKLRTLFVKMLGEPKFITKKEAFRGKLYKQAAFKSMQKTF
ncbi:hypothetical protein Y015_04815 [Chlamydia muridarum str. Nigg CM972]|nr:hypothetical protein TAC_04815 [Chlamydia muridarum str. Nigg3 CMUT3-5]AHH24222.1 hypothetical protein Y015_04815 [Chlamydia muridarum str. Nigg CM972]